MQSEFYNGQETRQVFSSVWDALEDTPFDAERMKIKSRLMMGITEIIRTNGWSQADAARRCCVTLPRIDDLLRGRINRFSIDELCNIVAALGHEIKIAIA